MTSIAGWSRMTTNHTEYGDHHFICFENAEGWWGEIYWHGRLVTTTTGSGFDMADTLDQAEAQCRHLIDSKRRNEL